MRAYFMDENEGRGHGNTGYIDLDCVTRISVNWNGKEICYNIFIGGSPFLMFGDEGREWHDKIVEYWKGLIK